MSVGVCTRVKKPWHQTWCILAGTPKIPAASMSRRASSVVIVVARLNTDWHRAECSTNVQAHKECIQLLVDCFGYCFSWPFFLIEFTHCIFSSLSLSIVLPFFLIEYPLSKCNRFSVKFSGNHKFGWGGGTFLALRLPVVEPRNMRATNAKAVIYRFS